MGVHHSKGEPSCAHTSHMSLEKFLDVPEAAPRLSNVESSLYEIVWC